ncbi:unnamed protein product [Closterium sp. Naga37s-1]|nr:unnamed protein product [Closterium sp. Naga37s-1]
MRVFTRQRRWRAPRVVEGCAGRRYGVMRGGRPIPARNTPISDHRPAPTNLPCLLRHRASRRARCPSARHHSLARAAIVLRNSPLAPTPPVQRGSHNMLVSSSSPPFLSAHPFRSVFSAHPFRRFLSAHPFRPFRSPHSFLPLPSPYCPPSCPPLFPLLSQASPPPFPLLSPSSPPHFPLISPSLPLPPSCVCAASASFPHLSPHLLPCFPSFPRHHPFALLSLSCQHHSSLLFPPPLTPYPPRAPPPPPCRAAGGTLAGVPLPGRPPVRRGAMQGRPRHHRSCTHPSFRPPCPSSALLFPSLSPNSSPFSLLPKASCPPLSPPFFPPFRLLPLSRPPLFFLLSPSVPILPPPSLSCPPIPLHHSSFTLPSLSFFTPLFPSSPPFVPPPFPMLPPACRPPALLCALKAPVLRRRAGEGTASYSSALLLLSPPFSAPFFLLSPPFFAAFPLLPRCRRQGSSQGRHGRRGRAASAALDVLRGGLTAASACTALTSLCGTTHFGRGIRLAPSTRRLGAPLLLGLGMRDGGATDLVSAALVRPPDGLDTHATNARDSDAADSDAADSDAADSVAAD